MASPGGIDGGEDRLHVRNIHGYILFAFAVGVAVFLAYLMREILLMIYVSALFAVVLMPVIRGIMRLRIGSWHPNRPSAVILFLMAVAAVVALFIAFALPPVIHGLTTLSKELPYRGPQMLGKLKGGALRSHIDFVALNAKIQGYVSNFAEYLLFSISSWATKLADIVMVIVLTIYFMLEGDVAYRWLLSLMPRRIRLRLDETLMRAEVRMGKWLLGQGSLMLILGVASTLVFALLKIRYAFALGILMGVLNIVPIVGNLVSISVVLLVAALDSWGKVLGALIFYLVYSQVETTYLTPRIMRTSVDLIGLAVLVALLMGSKLAGIVGAMVAVPTAVLVAVLIQEYLVIDDTADPLAG